MDSSRRPGTVSGDHQLSAASPQPSKPAFAKPKSKPQSKEKPNSSNPTPPSPPSPPPSSFRSASLSNPHNLPIKLGPSSSSHLSSSSSFSRLVLSRCPSFDPAASFSQTPVASINPPADVAKPSAKPKRAHPNSVFVAPAELEIPKRPKSRDSGNFVRLNINGYGKRKTYKNASTRYSTKSRFRRRRPREKGNVAHDNEEEEEDMVAQMLAEKAENAKCGELIEDAVAAAREEPSEQNLKGLLKLAFGYVAFRQGQVDAIRKVVTGKSMMLVLPTGPASLYVIRYREFRRALRCLKLE